jgi:hypothetical protein
MAALSNSAIKAILHGVHRALCDTRTQINWKRSEVESALTAVDSAMDTTIESTINLSFPLSFRTGGVSTVEDRAFLAAGVIIARLKVNFPTAFARLRTLISNVEG